MRTSGRVVVIGGGFAGLACAVALAGRGTKVIVLESRRHLGGRAASFIDEATGEVVDNGQHLFMSCYRDTLRFLAAVGTDHLVRFQKRLTVTWLEEGFASRLSAPPLPAPWHLVVGVLTQKGLGFADRMALLRAAPALRALETPGNLDELEKITVTAWLDRLAQTPRLKSRLWHPLAIATLNASPDAAPASLLARVLIEGFLKGRDDSRLGVATVGLGDLYAGAARRYLEARGGEVRAGEPVESLRVAGGRIEAARTRDGEWIDGDVFVSAVPPAALARLAEGMSWLSRFEASPILSVNLWLDRPISEVAPFDLAGLLDRRVQWIFNKERILRGRASHLAAVISAASELVAMPNEELAAIAWEDVQACLPAARGARLVRSMVVRERTATFAATVESEPLRPGQRSPYTNLLLAGDWTMRGLPATIEAAARSGHICAGLILDCNAP